MKIEQESIKIGILTDKYRREIFQPTEFQRCADAWSIKTKRGLIQTILDEYYVPPLLFSKNMILDGLQRISCLEEFVNNRFYIYDKNNKKKYFEDLEKITQERILDRTLIKISLSSEEGDPLDDNTQKELFYRINANSIKLNKAELIFTSCNPKNRMFISEISTDNPDLNNLASNKKGKRFSLPYLLLWCLTITYYRKTGYFDDTSKASIRNKAEEFVNLPFPEDAINDFKQRSLKTIQTLNNIFDKSIPPGKFKVIFSALFVAFYEEADSFNSFIENKDEISDQMMPVFKRLVDDQQIGGIHYDSYQFFKNRVPWIKEVLQRYRVDQKRVLTIKEKVKMYFDEICKNGGTIKCAKCGKVINSFNDIDFDHIFAYTKGGKTSIENSQILCKKCNRSKGAK